MAAHVGCFGVATVDTAAEAARMHILGVAAEDATDDRNCKGCFGEATEDVAADNARVGCLGVQADEAAAEMRDV